jgi:hypothetical protein
MRPCCKGQGAPKNQKKATHLPTTYFFWRYFEVLRKHHFYGLFKLAKNAVIERQERSFFLSTFLANIFDMEFPQKVFNFYGAFELPLSLVKKRTKTPLKKRKQKNGTYLPHLAAIWQIYVAFSIFFFGAPCRVRCTST